MVGGQANACSSSLALDEAIGILDSLIFRLQTSTPPEAGPSAAPVIEVPAESAKQGETLQPKLSLESTKLTAEQQEAGKGSILDRPGKKPPDHIQLYAARVLAAGGTVKLPGVPAEKPSKPSSAEKPSTAKGSENEENFEKAQFQVGLVQSVDDHPVAEKLYICKVEVASGQIRQVVAGIRNFIPAAELEGKKVALILNLKPAKLAGHLSEGMILGGEAHIDGIETVKVLEPPQDASVGDRIYLEGSSPSASPAKQLSSKIWAKVVPLLKVEGGVATFDKTVLVTSSGEVKVPILPNGAGIR